MIDTVYGCRLCSSFIHAFVQRWFLANLGLCSVEYIFHEVHSIERGIAALATDRGGCLVDLFKVHNKNVLKQIRVCWK